MLKEKKWGLGIGDWGLGIGDWGLGEFIQIYLNFFQISTSLEH